MRQVGYTAAQVTMDLRLGLIRALMAARWELFVKQRIGSLVPAITVEPGRAAGAYTNACRILVAAIQVATFTAIAAVISWPMTLAALIVGFVSIPLFGAFVRIASHAGKEQTRLQKTFVSRLIEGLSGIKPIKAMGGENHLAPLLESDVRGLNRVQRKLIISKESLVQLQEPVKVLALAVVLYFLLGSWTEGLEPLAVLAILFSRTVQRIQQLQRFYQDMVRNQPAFWFIRAVTRRAETARESLLGAIAPSFTESVTLNDVSFAYAAKPVLDQVCLTIPVHRMVGIVGASGAGKTTIADLVIGLLRPTSGRIEIDGKPLDEIDLRAWRKMIGYVPQETFLFHDTILTNLTLGDPAITRKAAELALERAGAWDFVAALPQGVESVVGERGTKLSGGQRQRLAIARALVRNPKLLILDEATTALDPETEAAICATMRQLTKSLTVLAISHQSGILGVADFVYRIEDNGLAVTKEGNRLSHTTVAAP